MNGTRLYICLPMTLAAFAFSHAGCAADLSNSLQGKDSTAPIDGEQATAGDGASLQTIDATDEEAWVYLDLETGEVVADAEQADATVWDLSIRRYVIALNGGVSGSGGVEVAVIEEAYEDIASAPLEGYITDVEDGPDSDEDIDHALSSGDTSWYAYDQTSHTLSPQGFVYVIHTVEGSYFKIEFLDYYNEAGSSGHVRVRFQEIPGADAGG